MVGILREKIALLNANPKLQFEKGFLFPHPGQGPEIEYRPSPPPVTLRAMRSVGGSVVKLLVRVGEKGLPTDTLLVSHTGNGMEGRTVLWASRIRFKPAMEAGGPVAVWLCIQMKTQVKTWIWD